MKLLKLRLVRKIIPHHGACDRQPGSYANSVARPALPPLGHRTAPGTRWNLETRGGSRCSRTGTHLPTVWLASCRMRLNCFFMVVSLRRSAKTQRPSATVDPKVALRRDHGSERATTRPGSVGRRKISKQTTKKSASRSPSQQAAEFL